MDKLEEKSVLSREDKYQAKLQKKAAPYLGKLKPGEQVLLLGRFSGMGTFFFYLAIVVALIVLNRIVLGNALLMLVCNIGVVIAAVEASKAVAGAQNSVAVVTDRRVMGIVGMKPFDLRYREIKSIGASTFLFLDTGVPQTSVRLKYLANAKDFYNTVAPLVRKAR